MSCTDRLLREAAEYAAGHGLVVHTHASENRGEIELVRRRTGRENVAYLDSAGLLTERTCLAHAVHTGAEEWTLLSERKTSVAQCVLQHAAGFRVCPVTDLARSGSTWRWDPTGPRAAARSIRSGRCGGRRPRHGADAPERISAFELLRMATWHGRGRCASTGPRARAGARADFVLLDPEAGWALPDEWSGSRTARSSIP